MRRTLPAILIPAAALCLVSAGDDAAMRSWPSWRGPLHTGVAPHGDPPLEWSETKNVRWKAELPGPGHATPVVWEDRIYVLSAVRTEKTSAPPAQAAAPPQPATAAPGGRDAPERPTQVHQFVVSAHDRRNGKELWRRVVREAVPREAGHSTSSHASASPITDGRRLYASFGSHGIYCLDLDGNVKWEVDLGDMTTRNQFGEGASPALSGDTLLVNWDHEEGSFIVGLDKLTGKERWRAARDEPTSWSTPLIVEDGGRALAVVSATKRVRAYDVATGAEVWQCGGLGANCIPSPVAAGGLVFVMSGYREAAAMAIRYPGARGDLTGGSAVAWRTDQGLSYVPSPLLYDGRLYLLERFQGMLSCLDIASGKPFYAKQRLEGMGNIYASPVGASGRVYLLDRDGNAMVLRHAETFEIMARNKLDDGFDASPVIAGDALYLRGHRSLYSLAASPAAP